MIQFQLDCAHPK